MRCRKVKEGKAGMARARACKAKRAGSVKSCNRHNREDRCTWRAARHAVRAQGRNKSEDRQARRHGT